MPIYKYQCKNCHSVYDEIIGDPTQNIPANTAFEQLPKNFTCNICDADEWNAWEEGSDARDE